MKIALGFLAGFIFLLSGISVSAQGDSFSVTTRTAQETRAEIRARREVVVERLQQLREEVQTRREERLANREQVRQRIEEQKAEVLERLLSRLIDRLDAYTERLIKLADRLQARVDKFAERGANTASAQSKLDDARAKIEAVKEDIAALAGVGDDLILSERPREFFQAIKDQVANVKDQFVEIHKTLASVLREVKGLSTAQRTGGEAGE